MKFWELIELFYWLQRLEFDGWYGIDIYPYRENGAKALQMAVDTVYWARKLAKRLESTPLAELQRDHDALEATTFRLRSSSTPAPNGLPPIRPG